MKKTILLMAMTFFVLQFSRAQDDAAKVQALLNNAINFNDAQLSGETPIQSVNRIASQQADTSLVLSKENIESALSSAKAYSKGIITVGQHTVVLIENWNDCQQSGAWGTCMPQGRGFVKKGEMKEMSDFINNIIGVPDGQRRTLFLFK